MQDSTNPSTATPSCNAAAPMPPCTTSCNPATLLRRLQRPPAPCAPCSPTLLHISPRVAARVMTPCLLPAPLIPQTVPTQGCRAQCRHPLPPPARSSPLLGLSLLSLLALWPLSPPPANSPAQPPHRTAGAGRIMSCRPSPSAPVGS